MNLTSECEDMGRIRVAQNKVQRWDVVTPAKRVWGPRKSVNICNYQILRKYFPRGANALQCPGCGATVFTKIDAYSE